MPCVQTQKKARPRPEIMRYAAMAHAAHPVSKAGCAQAIRKPHPNCRRPVRRRWARACQCRSQRPKGSATVFAAGARPGWPDHFLRHLQRSSGAPDDGIVTHPEMQRIAIIQQLEDRLKGVITVGPAACNMQK